MARCKSLPPERERCKSHHYLNCSILNPVATEIEGILFLLTGLSKALFYEIFWLYVNLLEFSSNASMLFFQKISLALIWS